MDKVKDLLHGGHKKEGEYGTPTGTSAPGTTGAVGGAGYGQPGVAQTTATHHEAGHEKKGGLLGGLGHKKEGEGGKKGGFMGLGGGSSSSSSSSDEDRDGAADRNRLRREKRNRKKVGVAGTTVPVEGEKKHGFFG